MQPIALHERHNPTFSDLLVAAEDMLRPCLWRCWACFSVAQSSSTALGWGQVPCSSLCISISRSIALFLGSFRDLLVTTSEQNFWQCPCFAAAAWGCKEVPGLLYSWHTGSVAELFRLPCLTKRYQCKQCHRTFMAEVMLVGMQSLCKLWESLFPCLKKFTGTLSCLKLEFERSQIWKNCGNSVVDASNEDNVIDLVIWQRWVGVVFPVKRWGGKKFLQYKKCVLKRLQLHHPYQCLLFSCAVSPFSLSAATSVAGGISCMSSVIFRSSVASQNNIVVCFASSLLKHVFYLSYVYGVHWISLDSLE